LFLAALQQVDDPERVRVHFRRLLVPLPQQDMLLTILLERPRLVEQLVTLFAASQFLAEILLQHPAYVLRLADKDALTQPLTPAELSAQANAALRGADHLQEELNILRRFQRWHLLRIGANDVWDYWSLDRVTRQLSDLAEALIRAALNVAVRRTGIPARGFVVLALGKLGGRELNYSSDVDLLFLAREHPSRYVPLGTRLIDVLSRVTPEGFLYRVDMRLRPWGHTGPLVTSVSGYQTYLRRHARLWECQALLKARPVAGNRALGAAMVRALPRLIFHSSPEEIQEAVRGMKERIEDRLHQKGEMWGEVKLGEGSIRDVEFIVQSLQLRYGSDHPGLYVGHTRKALARLHALGLLPTSDYRTLNESYTFLRTLEHHLQLMHNQQTHRLPQHPDRLRHLARRLGYTGPDAADRLVLRYEEHRTAIRRLYRRYLQPERHREEEEEAPRPLRVHLSRMAPSYSARFSAADIERHALMAARLNRENPVELDARLLEGDRWQVTIVAYDYLGELSLITGLLFVHGFNIIEGSVFTYERQRGTPSAEDGRRKIVDVFIVQSVRDDGAEARWRAYREELAGMLRHLDVGEWEQAQGELADRFAQALAHLPHVADVLYPVDIDIDNATSTRYTLLRISALDTVGFLYEFTNALALQGLYIGRVDVRTEGARVEDVLWIVDERGRKVIDPRRQQEVRVATVLVKQFTHLLPRSPDPKAALLRFRQFLGDLFRRPNWTEELISLQKPGVLHALARLLGVSDFLWNDFLRIQHEQLFPVLENAGKRIQRRSKATLWFDMRSRLERVQPEERMRALNAFKDREMFRVDMRYILGHADIDEFAEELSDLAEVVVAAALDVAYNELVSSYGRPLTAVGEEAPLVVCGLGKLGGREMGFASDVELMFLYRGEPQAIGTPEFFERLVQRFLQVVWAKREGVFEMDLQLRPYGKAGPLAVSLRAFEDYFRPGGPAWPYERQALIRLRPVAGNMVLGEEVVTLRDRLLYTGAPFDVDAMRAMRERQWRHLVKGGRINVKFSPGGLVDVEYLVQALQITYGAPYPELRTTNTAQAMARLADVGILTQENARRLREAHRFLRRLIEALRVARGHAKDLTVPPRDSDAYLFLARRMGYGSAPEQLWQELENHMAFVQSLNERLL